MFYEAYFLVAEAWSPYGFNNRRICLQSCCKEGFKAVSISIAHISCEI